MTNVFLFTRNQRALIPYRTFGIRIGSELGELDALLGFVTGRRIPRGQSTIYGILYLLNYVLLPTRANISTLPVTFHGRLLSL